MGSGGIINRGTIGVQTTTQPNDIKVTGSNNRAVAIENTGTINGGINVEGTLTGGTSSSHWGFHTSILNYKTISGGIKVDGTIHMSGCGSVINNGYMGTVNGNIIVGAWG
ncbi:hypothetical protein CUPS4064_01250 [Campylobacter upsaliensis]|uniref:hypothetical protein n=1 Tax=Campylobacter upsaliensis TaxID=28080 RepID=UPI00214A7DDC|nr:hypothetical protein [Campylobacter upsaliensis]MCR2112776.1 hypothetical protein [Campylobacter upsaliensis]